MAVSFLSFYLSENEYIIKKVLANREYYLDLFFVTRHSNAMATRLTEDHRNVIGKKLTNRLGLALKNGEIDAKGASEACKMILSLIDTFEYMEQLHALLQKLANGWPFFGEVLEFEEKTEKASQYVESMFEHRNVQYVGSS